MITGTSSLNSGQALGSGTHPYKLRFIKVIDIIVYHKKNRTGILPDKLHLVNIYTQPLF